MKYNTRKIKHYLFSFIPVCVYRQSDKFYLSFKFKTDNFKTLNYDDAPLLTQLKKMEPFTYIPNPGNMGDILIAAGTLLFFEKHHLKYKMFDGSFSGNLVYGGGGGFISSYKKHWQPLLENFQKADKVLILPSSFWDMPDLVKGVDSRFTIFARDRVSYQYLLSLNSDATVLLDHDMALRTTADIFSKSVKLTDIELKALESLYTKIKPLGKSGYLIRRDNESAADYPSDLDLSSCFRLDEKASPDWIYFGAQMMLAAVDRFDAFATDRLHVGIAGVLMGKEVYWLDNNYHKIKNVYEHSLIHHSNIHFCDALPDLNGIKSTPTATDNLEQMLCHIQKL